MWFPEKTPEKIPLEKREKLTADVISMCSEVAGQVDWDCVLPERDVVDEVKVGDFSCDEANFKELCKI